MIILSEAESQIVLFAKGHFKGVDNNFASVRILVANWLGIEVEYVHDIGVIACLKRVLQRCELDHFLSRGLEKLIFRDFFTKNMAPLERFVEVVMGILVNMPVFDWKIGEMLVKLESIDNNLFRRENV